MRVLCIVYDLELTLICRYKDLGTMTWHESWVAGLFAFVMLLWFFRSPKFMPGWGDLMSQGIDDEKKRR